MVGWVSGALLVPMVVDVAEFNTYLPHSDAQEYKYQIVFWIYDERQADHFCHGYLCVGVKTCPEPVYDYVRDVYVIRWYEGAELREVHAREVAITITDYDPEMVARRELPVNYRVKLW